MIKGLGIDIVPIEKVKRLLVCHPEGVSRLFTSTERAQASRYTSKGHYRYLSIVFASKEALVKALGKGFADTDWVDIEITGRLGEEKHIQVSGEVQEAVSDCGVERIVLASALCRKYAVAQVVLT